MITLRLSPDRARRLRDILSAIEANRQFQESSTLRRSIVYNLDESDINTASILAKELDNKIIRAKI